MTDNAHKDPIGTPASERAKALVARASDPDPKERYRALEEARRLPLAMRADVARHYLLDTSIWIRALAQSLTEPRRGGLRSRPAVLHELDEILRGTQVGTRQRASLARLLEDAQSFGSTSDLALAADRASRLVTQALSELPQTERQPLVQLQVFLRHVAAYAKPSPAGTKTTSALQLLARVASTRRGVEIHGDADARISEQPAETALRELLDNAREAASPTTHVNLSVNDGTAVIGVRNSGSALTDRQLENLFKPWFTTKEGHAGLGLYLAQVALAEVGGDVQLVSQEPVTFVVTLPLQTT